MWLLEFGSLQLLYGTPLNPGLVKQGVRDGTWVLGCSCDECGATLICVLSIRCLCDDVSGTPRVRCATARG